MSAANFRALRIVDLDRGLFDAWRRFHGQQDFQSPFTHPEFARAVAAVRPEDSFVSVMEVGGEPVGFLGHHRRNDGVWSPIGELVNDYQSPIMLPGMRWDARAWIKQLEFTRFAFDHVGAEATPFHPVAMKASRSHLIDTSLGRDAYFETLSQERGRLPSLIKQARRMHRNAVRDLGPVTFEALAPTRPTLDTLCALKSAQYMRTGARDVMALRWVRALIDRLHGTAAEGFEGRLSVLSAGGAPVAMHFGIATDQVWHYWFPVYDPVMARYKPGILLILEMVEAARAVGHRWIDFGKGDEEHKLRLKTGDYELLEGILAEPQWRASIEMRLHRGWRGAMETKAAGYIKTTPLGLALKRLRSGL